MSDEKKEAIHKPQDAPKRKPKSKEKDVVFVQKPPIRIINEERRGPGKKKGK